MPTIRQEINLLNTSYSGTGTVNANEIVQLDTRRYSGTVTYYFEVVFSGAASNTGNIRLTRQGTTTDDATVAGSTSSSIGLTRSSSFSPPAGATQYFLRLVGDGTRSQTVKAARIVIIQTGSIVLTETQIELGSNSSVTATTIPTGATNMTNPKYWLFTAANWDGALTVQFEGTFANPASSKANASLALQHDDGSFANWVTDITITTSSTTAAFVRTTTQIAGSGSGAPTVFSLISGRHYRVVAASSSSKTAMVVYSAKLIIQSVKGPALVNSSFMGTVSPSGGTGTDTMLWTTVAGNALFIFVDAVGGTAASENLTITDSQGNTFSSLASVVYSASTNKFYVFCATGIAGGASDVITFHSGAATIYPTAAEFSGVASSPLDQSSTAIGTSAAPDSGASATTTHAIDLVLGGEGTGGAPIITPVYPQMTTEGDSIASPFGGGGHIAVSYAYVAATGTVDASFTFDSSRDWACIVVAIKGDDTATLTKVEAQYLLANTGLAAGTALQNFLTKFDPAEWSGSPTFKHDVDASASNTSVVELDTAAGSQLSGSPVSSPNNEGTSGSVTMPGSAGNLDVKATTNSGSIFASRILVVPNLTSPRSMGLLIGV